MKKTNSIGEASGLVVKGQRGRSQSRDPKGIQRLLAVILAIFARNKSTSRKIV